MANIKISDLTQAAAASGTQEFEVNDSLTSKKVTGAQILAYVESEISSSPSFTGQVSFDDGSATSPSITNTGDSNTGIYFPSDDTVAIATGGTKRFEVDSSGNIVISGGLTVNGAFNLTEFASGTRLLFQQTAAPTGWTKDTTHNDKAMRIVSGTVGTGGTTAFSSVFASRTVSGTVSNTTDSGSISSVSVTGATDFRQPTVYVNNHTLSWEQMPYHRHVTSFATQTNTATSNGTSSRLISGSGTDRYSDYQGANWAHNHGASQDSHQHGFTANAHSHTLTMNAHNHTYSSTLDMAVQYVDVIIAVKD